VLGSCLGVMLIRRQALGRRSWTMIGGWVVVLASAASVDRRVLGAALTVAFLIQVVPAVVAAYRTAHPTGVARGTWLLVLGELSCWTVFGIAQRDGPLMTLGVTGVVSALAILRAVRPVPSPLWPGSG